MFFSAVTAQIEGKMSKSLKKLMKKVVGKEELTEEIAVADAKIGNIIKVCRRAVLEYCRFISIMFVNCIISIKTLSSLIEF